MTNTATISFRELVKLIHPDHNPTITDAGSKMRDASKHRKDETLLYRLGVYWGVINGNTSQGPVIKPVTNDDRQEALRRKAQRDAAERQAKWNDEESIARERFEARVRARIFREGDRIYVRTRSTFVTITKTTAGRVYFYWNNRETYAAKKNVRHAHWSHQTRR